MPTIVVPHRGAGGKQRLPEALREPVARAMLEDVVAACADVAPTTVVLPATEPDVPGATGRVDDPGRGQGAAVQAGLAGAERGPVVVVNSDVPAVEPRDVLALLGAVPPDGLALVEAADGTTNALALASPVLFAPLYGRGSAARFAALAPSRAVDVPNLVDDVDTVDDLERLGPRLGPRTRATLAALRAATAR